MTTRHAAPAPYTRMRSGAPRGWREDYTSEALRRTIAMAGCACALGLAILLASHAPTLLQHSRAVTPGHSARIAAAAVDTVSVTSPTDTSETQTAPDIQEPVGGLSFTYTMPGSAPAPAASPQPKDGHHKPKPKPSGPPVVPPIPTPPICAIINCN